LVSPPEIRHPKLSEKQGCFLMHVRENGCLDTTGEATADTRTHHQTSPTPYDPVQHRFQFWIPKAESHGIQLAESDPLARKQHLPAHSTGRLEYKRWHSECGWPVKYSAERPSELAVRYGDRGDHIEHAANAIVH
jgi:hypothetical protein